MSETSREQRRTAKLREILPLYAFIELTVEALGAEARCSVPLTAATSNHFGVMHAGVLFSLAEAAGGLAFSAHAELRGRLVIAKRVEVAYRRQAKSTIHAAASVSDTEAARYVAALADDPKAAWPVEVALRDESGETVADAVCTFVLR